MEYRVSAKNLGWGVGEEKFWEPGRNEKEGASWYSLLNGVN